MPKEIKDLNLKNLFDLNIISFNPERLEGFAPTTVESTKEFNVLQTHRVYEPAKCVDDEIEQMAWYENDNDQNYSNIGNAGEHPGDLVYGNGNDPGNHA